MEIKAAVVEPVGRKAYWSSSRTDVVGEKNEGYMYLCTRSLSVILERTGTTEMGRKSTGDFGWATLGTGLMTAIFHCSGTWEWDSERLMRSARIAAYTGAASFRNHEGIPSAPSAV